LPLEEKGKRPKRKRKKTLQLLGQDAFRRKRGKKRDRGRKNLHDNTFDKGGGGEGGVGEVKEGKFFSPTQKKIS